MLAIFRLMLYVVSATPIHCSETLTTLLRNEKPVAGEWLRNDSNMVGKLDSNLTEVTAWHVINPDQSLTELSGPSQPSRIITDNHYERVVVWCPSPRNVTFP